MGETELSNIVYVPMCADIVHGGHLNIIKEARKHGQVVVGLLTDEAIASKKRLPLMNYNQRFEVVSNLKGVTKVIPQAMADYRPNLQKLKPSFVVHGNDWKAEARQQVVDSLNQWDGKLIEVEYTDGISSTQIQRKLKTNGIMPTDRTAQLARLLDAKHRIRALEAHDGISGLVVENSQLKQSGKLEVFDAIWVSSLTDSIAKGKPDTELVDRTSRLSTIQEILDVTTKPLIVDGDTGGHPQHFSHFVRKLEQLGVSAIVIEDKNGLKRNSLYSDVTKHQQEDPKTFAVKIKAGLQARTSESFMIIARIESLVLGKNQSDALLRAKTYLAAGASAIMIHSKDSSGKDIRNFARAYSMLPNSKPLVLVPTSYNKLSEGELAHWGADIIIYANHLLRAAVPAMEATAQSILEHGRSFEIEPNITPIDEFLRKVAD